MPTRDAYYSGHLVPSLWDLHIFYLLRPILFSELVVISPDYALRISLGTFSILPFNEINVFELKGKGMRYNSDIVDNQIKNMQ